MTDRELTDEQRARLLAVRKARLRQLLAGKPFTRERKAAMRELLGNRRRANPEIARAAGVHERTVRRARADLEGARVIGVWRPAVLTPLKPLRPLHPPSMRDRARAALLADAERLNTEIAAQIGTGRELVRRVRNRLEAAGTIAAWRPPSWTPPGTAPGRDRVRCALLADAKRADVKIAAEAGVSASWVMHVRHDLEAAGEIPRWRGQARRGPVTGAP